MPSSLAVFRLDGMNTILSFLSKSSSIRSSFIRVGLICVLPFLSSCNLTEKIDNPRGDAQILSAARACLDLGDYECAFKYYSKLSNDVGEVKGTEIAFATLDKIGLGLGAFLKSFSNLASTTVMIPAKVTD